MLLATLHPETSHSPLTTHHVLPRLQTAARRDKPGEEVSLSRWRVHPAPYHRQFLAVRAADRTPRLRAATHDLQAARQPHCPPADRHGLPAARGAHRRPEPEGHV